jgi:hypothetical protein
MKRIGDVSRRRRLADPARRLWYGHSRAVRLARRMLGVAPDALSSFAARLTSGSHRVKGGNADVCVWTA